MEESWIIMLTAMDKQVLENKYNSPLREYLSHRNALVKYLFVVGDSGNKDDKLKALSIFEEHRLLPIGDWFDSLGSEEDFPKMYEELYNGNVERNACYYVSSILDDNDSDEMVDKVWSAVKEKQIIGVTNAW